MMPSTPQLKALLGDRRLVYGFHIEGLENIPGKVQGLWLLIMSSGIGILGTIVPRQIFMAKRNFCKPDCRQSLKYGGCF